MAMQCHVHLRDFGMVFVLAAQANHRAVSNQCWCWVLWGGGGWEGPPDSPHLHNCEFLVRVPPPVPPPSDAGAW